MTALRRLAWIALVLAFGQIVFGAIVRITGSGMGCGDHWPQCSGYWIPPLERPDLIIEVTHRYIAAALTVVIVWLSAVAFVRRRLAGVGGPGGVARATFLAAALVVAAALFGAATVKLELANKAVIVTHLAIAMTLLAVLVVAIQRTYETGTTSPPVSLTTLRSGYAALALTFLALVLGALTAHLPGANVACGGFPLCNGSWVPTAAVQHVQYTHRLVAFVLLMHMIGFSIGVRRRAERSLYLPTALTFAAIIAQIVIAAFLVERNLPLILRSLHEAVGTLIWLFAVWTVVSARRLALHAARALRLAGLTPAAEGKA
ncbi:MAG: COX15/CtaA family protein [Gemmatimonadota bacterium]